MIILTGMHRSGTSLVAMTLEAIGVPFGDHSAFYSADQWNEHGYFERRDVMDLNSRMITGFPRTTGHIAASASQLGYLVQPSLESVVRNGHAFAREMRRVRDEVADGAIKDPRLCLTWSAWAEHVEVDACVVSIRHPFDVAESLRRRQRIPVALGMRSWRYHMRALRLRTPDPLLVVDLDSLIRAPRLELSMLVTGLGLDVDPDSAVASFQTKYAPGMTKTSEPADRPPLTGEAVELWDWLGTFRAVPSGGRLE